MARKTFRVNADSVDTLVDILVANPEDFNADSDKLRGRNDRYPMAGRLNGVEYDTFMANRAQNRITYVIYSYNTPIAWRVYDRATFAKDVRTDWEQHWVMPNGTGSMTTAKHINKVRTALSQISGGIDCSCSGVNEAPGCSHE